MRHALNEDRLRSVALTFDIDWAPDFAIEAVLSALDRAGVSATLFVTHPTPLLTGLDPSRFELGLHPHLPDRLDLNAALDKVRPLAPDARGVRFHRLIQSTPLMFELGALGFAYDASLLLPYQPGLRPFRFPAPLVRIPYSFEDDVHAFVGRPWDDASIGLTAQGLKIFDFHPIHVFLNTEDLSRYARAKAAGFTLSACRDLINPGPGAGRLLETLLRRIQNDGLHTYRLSELAEAVARGEVIDGCAVEADAPAALKPE